MEAGRRFAVEGAVVGRSCRAVAVGGEVSEWRRRRACWAEEERERKGLGETGGGKWEERERAVAVAVGKAGEWRRRVAGWEAAEGRGGAAEGLRRAAEGLWEAAG